MNADRRDNVRVGWAVFLAMLACAAVGLAYALATTAERRSRDFPEPEKGRPASAAVAAFAEDDRVDAVLDGADGTVAHGHVEAGRV